MIKNKKKIGSLFLIIGMIPALLLSADASIINTEKEEAVLGEEGSVEVSKEEIDKQIREYEKNFKEITKNDENLEIGENEKEWKENRGNNIDYDKVYSLKEDKENNTVNKYFSLIYILVYISLFLNIVNLLILFSRKKKENSVVDDFQ